MPTREWLIPNFSPMRSTCEPAVNPQLGYEPFSIVYVCPTCGESWGVSIVVPRSTPHFRPHSAACPRHQRFGLTACWIDTHTTFNQHLPAPLLAEYVLYRKYIAELITKEQQNG